MDSLTLKSHDPFQNQNNRKSTRAFFSRPLIFKLQEEVLKFNDICVSWSCPKTGLETNFLNLNNWSIEKVKFFSVVTFNLINLFISLIKLKRTSIKHPIKEHRCKFKINELTYSKFCLEQRITLRSFSVSLIRKFKSFKGNSYANNK